MAFFVGWQLMLDQILSVASVCSAVSGAINAASEGAIRNFTVREIGVFNHPLLAPYPDLVGVGVAFLAAFTMSFGLGRSGERNFVVFSRFLNPSNFLALLSNVLNMVNLLVIVFCICFGFALGDVKNWTYNGFLPFGFQGVMEGACNSFTSYIGFEGIASAGTSQK